MVFCCSWRISSRACSALGSTSMMEVEARMRGREEMGGLGGLGDNDNEILKFVHSGNSDSGDLRGRGHREWGWGEENERKTTRLSKGVQARRNETRCRRTLTANSNMLWHLKSCIDFSSVRKEGVKERWSSGE
jgi:hypothetical protein